MRNDTAHKGGSMSGDIVWYSRLRGKQGVLMVVIYWHRQVHADWVSYLKGDAVTYKN